MNQLFCLVICLMVSQIVAGEYTVNLTENEWRERLDPESFHVLREKGTERAFTGAYWDHKDDGVYACKGCGEALYDSKTKFDSGTGWPSFWDDMNKATEEKADYKLFVKRTELLCATCGGHLGHVFDDGPAPTGKRHCINSAALEFQSRGSNEH